MKVSLITTVYNEEATITPFLKSVLSQSKMPDEIIIVDGGSTDDTIAKIKNLLRSRAQDRGEKSKFKKYKSKLIILQKKGNRSVGRNEAIEKAQNDIIAISDAGNILDRRWIKNITKPFLDKKTDVVTGYYKGLSKNIFEKCLIPYVLVMPDKANAAEEFLPATRSMAIKKSVWKKMGGFDEKLSHNEDYAFANKLKEAGAHIYFAKDAVVNWIPRKDLRRAFVMFFRFAFGDSEARIFRDKVVYIFLRYLFGVYLFFLSVIMQSITLWILYLFLIILYLGWSIKKNYKYIKNYKAFLYLPLLQITSDLAIMPGTMLGLIKNISLSKFVRLILNNKGLTILIISYIFTMLSVIDWGIPNINHPFDYQMDEWHQSQSVRGLFKYGTPNIPGAANGTIFQFFLTGIFLIPFYIFRIVNPFAIKSSVLNLEVQQRLFEVLRLNTLLFGILSIILIYYLVKKYFKINGILVVFLITVNPLWLMLSNYFKYDISLMFWILMALLFLLRYINNPKTLNFVLAGIFSGLAFSVKVSAIPLLPILIIAFLLYNPHLKTNFKSLFAGILIFLLISVFFGIPDVIFNKGDLMEYLVSNLIRAPKFLSNNFDFGMNFWTYFLTRIYPVDFGKSFYSLSIFSIVSFTVLVILKLKNQGIKIFLKTNKNFCLIFISFVCFALSLYPLQIGAIGNRMLVLLPFMVIVCGLFLSTVLSHKNTVIKTLTMLIIVILFSLQIFDSYKYFRLKIQPDPRVMSSNWIINNLKPGTTIGIENIPIYQSLPDVILKDFYLQQYGVKNTPLFSYKVVGYKDKLPKIMIISSDNLETKFWLKSDKTNLVKKINKDGYKVVKRFEPDFKYFSTPRDRFDLSLSGLIPIPDSISIYEK